MTAEEYRRKLFERLDTLDERYHRFVTRVGFALVILFGTIAWQYFVVTPEGEKQIRILAASRADDAKRFAESQAREAERTTATLCVFRRDLEARVRTSREFLHDHPKGFAGISPSAIRVSLNGQERTIAALSGLHCHT